MANFIVKGDKEQIEIGMAQLTDRTVTIFAQKNGKRIYILNINEDGIEFVNMSSEDHIFKNLQPGGIPKINLFGSTSRK